MAGFYRIALVAAHQPIPAFLNYGISDLTELCALAAYVRDVVDQVLIPVCPTDRDPLAGFSAYMREHRPQLVGISAYSCSASASLRYAQIAKELGAFVVLGGYHASALPEEMLQSPHVDAVVRGEGEETLRELIRLGPSPDTLGLSFRDGDRIVHNAERPVIADLDTLPLPLREIRPVRFGLDGLSYHVDSIYTSRGCRGKCTFCANHLVGKRWRKRSNKHVLQELATIAPSRGKKRKLVKLWDASFMTDTARTAELCDLIISNGLHKRFRFNAETRVEDIIRGRDILPLMKEAGFIKLGTGVESPNRQTLRRVKKGVLPEAVDEAARLVSDSGMVFAKFFIIGHDNENLQDILRYADFAVSRGLRRQSAYFFAMTPYPGTEVYTQYRRRGLIRSDDWDLYTNYVAVIEPDGVPQLTLQAMVGTLPIQYSLAKRFARGEPWAKLVLKLLGLLLASAKVFQMHRAFSRESLEAGLWEGLEHLQELPSRPVDRDVARPFFQTFALRFFHGDCKPLTLSFRRDGGHERMSISRSEEKDPSTGRSITLNFSLRHLYRLAEVIDPRCTGHDVITLILRPSAFKLRWAFSLLAQAAKTAPVLAAMVLFDLRVSATRVLGQRKE